MGTDIVASATTMADIPLAARMRPRSFDEFAGQSHLVGPGKALTELLEGGHLPSIVLWGPAGTGKTTLAHLLADAVSGELVQLSAVSSGVADARKVMSAARGGMFRTILFVDEVHRWSKAQQDVLLPAVEDGTITLIGATTENPYFSLVTPLLSRCLLLRLEPLTHDDLRRLMQRALEDADRGLGTQGVNASEEALDHLAEISGGDARIALTGLEAAVLSARSAGEDTLTLERTADAVQHKAIVYDRQGDAHYDVISAFIKSIRGSDPDGALFWLVRMLEAGEDARFIARPIHGRCSSPRRRRTRWSTSACPRRASTWPRPRSTSREPRSPTAWSRRSQRRWRTPSRATPSHCTCAMRARRPRASRATGRVIATPTTTPATASSRSIGPRGSPARATTSPRARARTPELPAWV
jgi:putative ATPase